MEKLKLIITTSGYLIEKVVQLLELELLIKYQIMQTGTMEQVLEVGLKNGMQDS